MPPYIDTPTVLIYAFWIFFFFLVVYLRREDKREGYPLESDRQGVVVQGWPAIPEPKAARAKHPALAAPAAASASRAPTPPKSAPPTDPTPQSHNHTRPASEE